jgi:hypothetical protein
MYSCMNKVSIFPPPPLFFVGSGSGIRDKHPGFATLLYSGIGPD